MTDYNGLNDANDIAIIGLACRVPGANTPNRFWRNLVAGKESLSALSDEELELAGIEATVYSQPGYVKSGMFLQGYDQFDAGFFNLSPLEAKIMDPQHRHFLECCWEAFEDSAYDPAKFEGSIGVFAGSGHNAYLPYNLLTNPALIKENSLFLVRHTGNDKDFLTTRASYIFDLKGPSVNIQTACSTSLVAIHQAAQSLLNGECDMAMAGGVSINLPHREGYQFKEGEILSSDGHCRPFDANANGTVFGSGVGVIALRRLDDAIKYGDNIHAVIKSSAINNDGAGKVSYLSPSIDGQANAIKEALDIGDIDPKTVSYIECHGTGTAIGDPIEIEALSLAYGRNNPKHQYCSLGSVKANIGHLDTAAGVAGLIKVVMALKNKQLPSTLHYKTPNPSINFANSPFYINTQSRQWLSDGPRRAGISSLGVGGTNAHIILEEAPAYRGDDVTASKPWQLLLLSSQSEQGLKANGHCMAQFLNENPNINFCHAAYTSTQKKSFAFRQAVIAQSGQQAAEQLLLIQDNKNSELVSSGHCPEKQRDIAMMFAGAGSQYVNMGLDLYTSEPLYQQAVDKALALINDYVDFDMRAVLFPEQQNQTQAKQDLLRPSRALPALFITQYAQAQLWLSWGIEATAFIGHSVGETTAACLAGVFRLEDAIALIALRGKLFETLKAGAMLSVPLSEAATVTIIQKQNLALDIAAVNATELCVASGPLQAIKSLQAYLDTQDISSHRIHVDVAAHSRMLEEILVPYKSFLENLELSKPQHPLLSNLSGQWISDEQATSAQYWQDQLRHTVNFNQCAKNILTDNNYILLEVGPGTTLSSLLAINDEKKSVHAIYSSLRHPNTSLNDLAFMLKTLAGLWQSGAIINWDQYFQAQNCRRISLPTYQFEHKKYWIEPGNMLTKEEGLSKAITVDKMFYSPVWHKFSRQMDIALTARKIILFGTQNKFSKTLLKALEDAKADVRTITLGNNYKRLSTQHFTIGTTKEDIVSVFQCLASEGFQPQTILHTLNSDLHTLQGDKKALFLAFDSLLYITQVIAEEMLEDPLRLCALSFGLHALGESVLSQPLQALSLGPIRVAPREILSLQSQHIDLPLTALQENEKPIPSLLALLSHPIKPSTLCIRGHSVYSQEYEIEKNQSYTDHPSENPHYSLKAGGNYIITGGLGGLGLLTAEHLAQQEKITLILISRRDFPPRKYWTTLLAKKSPEAAIIQKLQYIESLGSRIEIISANITSLTATEKLTRTIKDNIGKIQGIFHLAGTINDGVLIHKNIDDAHAVITAKVNSIKNLLSCLQKETLDFVILFSSSSAIAGLSGQIDYTAANAFLDAYAQQEHESNNLPIVSINWTAWKETGMAAGLLNSKPLIPEQGRPIDHPMLDRIITETADCVEFISFFSQEKDWFISEHALKTGTHLLPGTAYIELARSAFAQAFKQQTMLISQVSFKHPFIVSAAELKEIHIRLELQEGGYSFSIYSGSSKQHMEHASGLISTASQPLAAAKSSTEILHRCPSKQLFTDENHHPQLNLGPRWQSLESVNYGLNEALNIIHLPEKFQQDLDKIIFHPAMMDMAIAGAQIIIDGYNPETMFYVPIAYASIHCIGNTPRTFYSHIRRANNSVSNATSDNNEKVSFDIDLITTDGCVFMQIRGFEMQKFANLHALSALEVKAHSTNTEAIEKVLSLGIDDNIGMQALDCILQQGIKPNIAVSAYDIGCLTKVLTEPLKVAPELNGVNDDEHTPQSNVQYAAPTNDCESKLADLWKKTLGLTTVSIDDDFFQLGGHSLLLTRIVSKAKKEANIQLTLSRLYAKPSIREWAKMAEEDKHEDIAVHKVALKKVSREQYRI